MTRPEKTDETPRIVTLIIWLALVAVLLYNFRTSIGQLDLRDTDDALRLVQIRDWMNGQSWFDVTQHRVNPPHGGIMHWSRLIDVPIAALILLFRLFFAPPVAEQIAIVLYPMLLLGVLLAMITRFVARMADRETAIWGLILAATSTFVFIQLVPLRIDHHGPQLLIAFAVLFQIIAPPSVRTGLVSGALFALYLSISFEGLPYLAMVGALFALDWLRGRDDGARIGAFAAAFTLIGPAILMATRGLDALWPLWCDAWSAPYWQATAVATAVLVGGLWTTRQRGTVWTRLLILAFAGAAGTAAFVLRGNVCLAGPFAELDPLVRDTWYANVIEGQPIWRQARTFPMHLVMPSLLGIAATTFAWRRAGDAERRRHWGIMLFMLVGAAVVAVMVGRAISLAHIYAIPGLASAAVAILRLARKQERAAKRVGLTLLTLFTSPTFSALTTDMVVDAVMSKGANVRGGHGGLSKCLKRRAYVPLAAMSPTLVFGQVDVSSHLLLYSRHSVIATPHHRNHKAMAVVYRAFMSHERKAETTVRGTGATHLLFCANSGESGQMARRAPAGLAAALRKERVPDWLTPVYRDPKSKLVLYRVTPL